MAFSPLLEVVTTQVTAAALIVVRGIDGFRLGKISNGINLKLHCHHSWLLLEFR